MQPLARSRTFLLACAAVTTLFSGCAGQDEPSPAGEAHWAEFVDDTGNRQTTFLAPGAGLIVGKVTTLEGSPLQDAHAVLLGTQAADTTNEIGAFQFVNVAAGTYQLRVDAEGFEPVHHKFEVREHLLASLQVRMEPAPEPSRESITAQTINSESSAPWPLASALLVASAVALIVFAVLARRSQRDAGMRYLSAGRLDRAEQKARRVLAKRPGQWTAAFVLGAVLLRFGKAAEAVKVLETAAAKLDPKMAGLGFLLVLGHQRLGNTVEARRWLPLVARNQEYWDALDLDPEIALERLTAGSQLSSRDPNPSYV